MAAITGQGGASRFTSGVLVALFLATVLVDSADAGRRSLRVDFGAWSDAAALGSAECPGSAAGSSSVAWNGYLFIGSSFNVFEVDTYCQSANTYEEFLSTDEYLNSDIFFEDEAGLAAKVGINDTEPFITGRRYTFLDGDRFEFDTTGFQWAFYFFPNGITLVTLYGEVPVDAEKFDPYITEGAAVIWDSLVSGYDGEYFCFDGHAYIGLWDGENAGTDPAAGCALPPRPEVIYSDGFEIPEFE